MRQAIRSWRTSWWQWNRAVMQWRLRQYCEALQLIQPPASWWSGHRMLGGSITHCILYNRPLTKAHTVMQRFCSSLQCVYHVFVTLMICAVHSPYFLVFSLFAFHDFHTLSCISDLCKIWFTYLIYPPPPHQSCIACNPIELPLIFCLFYSLWARIAQLNKYMAAGWMISVWFIAGAGVFFTMSRPVLHSILPCGHWWQYPQG